MNYYINNNITKAFLAFFWLLPFLYMFIDTYFFIPRRLPLPLFQFSLFLSLFSSFVLVLLWFKEFREIFYQKKVFTCISTGDLITLDKILNKITSKIYTYNALTPLQYAVDKQLPVSTVIYLLSKDFTITNTINKQHDLDYTLFYICAYYNHVSPKIISTLVNIGANINFVDTTKGFKGLSVLNVLTLRNNQENISLALNLGADVHYEIQDLSMNSLMLVAKYVSDPFVVKQLIDENANIHLVNKDGYNALLFAANYNPNPAIFSILVNYGSVIKPYNIKTAILKYNCVTPLMLAASYNNSEVVKTIINLGDDPNYKDSFGLSVLFMAAANNSDVDVIKTLVNSGANISESKDAYGNTPLMAASYLNRNPNIIRYLLERTHNLHSKNKDGLTFIDYLKQNQFLSNSEKEIIVNKWA